MNFIDRFLARRRSVLALSLGFALAMAPGLLRIQHDNAPEVFFVRDAQALQQQALLREHFGGDRAMRVVLRGAGLWTAAGLTWLKDLELRAVELPGVARVDGVYTYHRYLEIEWPPPDPAAFRKRVTGDALDRAVGWVNADGDVATVLLTLHDPAAADEAGLVDALHDLLATAPDGIDTAVAGIPVVQRAMDDSLRQFVMRLFPLLVLAALLLLLLTLRRLADALLLLGFVALVQIITFGAMGYAGVNINMVTIVLVPLLFVITLATAVHILVRYRSLATESRSPDDAVRRTYNEKGWPVLWTGVTTCVALGSFATSPNPPLSNLGLWSALGIALMTAMAFAVYPVLLVQLKSEAAASDTWFERLGKQYGERWAQWASGARGVVLGAAALIVALSLWGATRLDIETNVLSYFYSDHPMRVELEALERDGLAAIPAALVVTHRDAATGKVKHEDGFRDPRALTRLFELTTALREDPLVHGAVGAGDLFASIKDAVIIEGGEDYGFQVLLVGMLQGDAETARRLDAFVTPDGARARIMLLTPMRSFAELDATYAQAVAIAREKFPEATVQLAGQYPLVLGAQRTLLRTMFISVTVTLLCIVAIFAVLLRSARMTLLILAPNLWPLIVVLGAMGWFHVAINGSTVMVAAVVLGLAVDDTLHSLGYFRRLAPELGAREGVIATLQRAAPAHVLTALILAVGFALCGLAEFVPVASFGLLTAVAVTVALIGDLLLIPALLAAVPAKVVDRFAPGPRAPSG